MEAKYNGGIRGSTGDNFANHTPDMIKLRGNEYFKEGEFLQAIRCYELATAYHCVPVILKNLSQAYIQVEIYEKAADLASESLFFDKQCFKANFRYARA